MFLRTSRGKQKDKKPYLVYLMIMIITSSEQICVTVHDGANILIFDLTVSPQMPGGQLCSRSYTEEIKHLNYNIKYLNYSLVCIFYQNY